MKKSLIGVLPLYDKERNSFWMLPGYVDAIERAGGIPVMLPLTSNETILSQLLDTVDGILFTGGQDVYPMVYNQSPSKFCGEVCLERDDMEQKLLRLAMKQDKPLLGICRGIQILNATLGGSLYQDIAAEYKSEINHRQEAPYDKPVHTVRIIQDSPLYRLLGKDLIPVNSCHHQAVKSLGKELQVMAYSEDGLVEAVCVKDKKFMWAVQWHPECSYLTNDASMKIFEEFVAATTRK